MARLLMDKDLAAIIALLLTDGSLTLRTQNRIEIALDSTSETLHQEFSRLMKTKFGLNSSRYKIKSRAFSYAVGTELLNYTGTYRTKFFKETNKFPDTHIPEEIKHGDAKLIQHFLKYAFTCDGSAGLSIQKGQHTKNCWFFQKRIQLACKHPTLLEEYKKILEKIGIHSRVSISQGKLFIENREGIESFYERLKFLDGVVMCGKGNSVWKGMEKNEMLKTYKFLYKISDSLKNQRFYGGYWMKNFKTKEQIVDFLKKC